MVTSPNYPENYPYGGMEKIQTILVDQGLLLSLEITAFDIARVPSKSTCKWWDYLTITDGDGTTLLEKSCGSLSDGNILIGSQNVGSSLPANITSRTNLINLVFKTSSTNLYPKSGWRVRWTAVAQGECQQRVFIHYSQRLSFLTFTAIRYRGLKISVA